MASRAALPALLLALPLQVHALAIGGQWQLDSTQPGKRAEGSGQFWLGVEQETEFGLLFVDGQTAGLALPLYDRSFIAIGVSPMPRVERTHVGAMWRLGWQLDDDHQLTLGQLIDTSGRYGQLWYMEHSLPLPGTLSLNLWLTRGNQAYMAGYDVTEGWRDWGVALERSWHWQRWQLSAEGGAKQWLIKEHEWQPMLTLTLSYHVGK